jgi:hypothetical protein
MASYFAKIQAQVYWVHVSSIFPLSSSGFQMFHALAECDWLAKFSEN